jgi:hypothetical protein
VYVWSLAGREGVGDGREVKRSVEKRAYWSYLGETDNVNGNIRAELGTDLHILVLEVCWKQWFVEKSHLCTYVFVLEGRGKTEEEGIMYVIEASVQRDMQGGEARTEIRC